MNMNMIVNVNKNRRTHKHTSHSLRPLTNGVVNTFHSEVHMECDKFARVNIKSVYKLNGTTGKTEPSTGSLCRPSMHTLLTMVNGTKNWNANNNTDRIMQLQNIENENPATATTKSPAPPLLPHWLGNHQTWTIPPTHFPTVTMNCIGTAASEVCLMLQALAFRLLIECYSTIAIVCVVWEVGGIESVCLSAFM